MKIAMHVFFALMVINAFVSGWVSAEPRLIGKNNITKWMIIILAFLFGIWICFGNYLYKKYERKLGS